MNEKLRLMLEAVKECNIKNSTGPLYTAEKELLLSSTDLVNKLNSNTSGSQYTVLFTENIVNLRANELFQAELIDEINYLLIPDWDLFITALDVYTDLTKFVRNNKEV